jgi:hypothetical protein
MCSISSLYKKVNLHDSNLESPQQPGVSVRFFNKKKPARRRLDLEFDSPVKGRHTENDYMFETSTPRHNRPLPDQPGYSQPLSVETSFDVSNVTRLQYTNPSAPMYSPPIAKTAKPWSIIIINKYRAMLSMQSETDKYYWVPCTGEVHTSDGTITRAQDQPSLDLITSYKTTMLGIEPVTLPNVIELTGMRNIMLDNTIREFYILKSRNLRKYLYGYRKYTTM